MPMDYDSLFGGGAMGAHYALQDRDLEREKAQQAMAMQQENIKQQQLANMFAEQNNPLKLQEQTLSNEQMGYTNRQKKLDTSMNEELAPLKFNAEQKKYIQQVKQSDLDGMEYEAQRMAYSPNKEEAAEGLRLLQMHKDFVRLREQQKFTTSERVAGQGHDFALQAQRAKDAQALEGSRQAGRAAAKAQAGAGIKSVYDSVASGKVSPANAAAAFGARALEAEASGDLEQAQLYRQAASQFESLAVTVKPDSNAGKMAIDPNTGTIGQRPARAPTFGGQPPAPAPAKPPTQSLADVQKMYPGVPADKIREAYKRKFGVDLK